MKLNEYLLQNYKDKQRGKTIAQFCRDFGITRFALRAYLKTGAYEVVTVKDGRTLLFRVFNDCEKVELEGGFVIAKIVGECK